MAVLTIFRHKFWDDAGFPLSGGQVYTYAPGTTTPIQSFTDSTGVVPNTNPVILDSKGEANIWTVGMFKVNVTTSTGAQVTGYPVDNIGYDISLQGYASAIHGATNKVTPNAADETGIWDSISGLFNKLTIGNLLGSGLPGIFSSVVSAGPVTMATATLGGHGVNLTQANLLYGIASNTAIAAGTADAITATYTPSILALTNGLRLIVRAGFANATTTPTFAPDAMAAKTIVKGNNIALTIGDISGSGHWLELQYDTTFTAWVLINPSTGIFGDTRYGSAQFSIASSVGSSALTASLNPCKLDFRSATLTTGVPNNRAVPAAISLVVPSTATLGTVSAVQSRLVLLAIDNAGTVELAVTNLAGGLNLDETTLISTTALSAASTASNVIYSTTARTNVPFRVVGFLDITEATAGTWATNPTTIQGVGGNLNIKSASMVRLNTANGYGSTNTSIRRLTNIVTNRGTDITYADSATLGGSFTINAAGVYAISYSDSFTAASYMGVSLNTTQPTTGISAIPIAEQLTITTTGAASYSSIAMVTLYLEIGSVIRAHALSQASGTQQAIFTITRVG